MSSQPASPLNPGDEPQTIATVVSAFAADPVERWLYAADQDYEQNFPSLVAALGGRAFEQGSAWCLEDQSAVALWLGPGVVPDDDAVVAVLSESVAVLSESVAVLSESVAEGKQEETFRYSGRWATHTLPTRIGICPGWQSSRATRAPASAAGSSLTAWRSSTKAACRPFSRPRTRAT